MQKGRALALTFSLLLLGFGPAAGDNEDTYRQLKLFGDVFERVRADYVEEVSDEQLIESAIRGMLTDLLRGKWGFRGFVTSDFGSITELRLHGIAKDDAGKYFAVIDLLFRQQNEWVMKNTTETLSRIGKQAGLSCDWSHVSGADKEPAR